MLKVNIKFSRPGMLKKRKLKKIKTSLIKAEFTDFKKLLNLRLKKISKIIRCLYGQSTVEFLLVLPFLTLIMLFIAQVGHIIYIKNVVEHAARETARIITTTNSNDYAINTANKILNTKNNTTIIFEIEPKNPSSRFVGDYLNVKITCLYGGIANIIKLITGDNIKIQSNCSMRMEFGNDY